MCGWKAAIGAPLDDPGFDPSSLVYWRNRIARSARPHRISDAVQKVVRETGVLRGRRRRAVDSTILADAVATQDTVTQLVSAIRKVAREVPGAAGQVARVCTGHDYGKPGKPKIDWTIRRRRTRWCRPWSATRTRWWPRWNGRDLMSGPRRRWRCWPWWPGRTWSPPGAPTVPAGGGGSPARSPKTG